MGMGYGANIDMVIEQSDIKKIVPYEFENFLLTVENFGVPLDSVADAIDNSWEIEELDEDETQQDDILNAWDKVANAFRSKTGIRLWIRYHSPDMGSRYDDISGVFFVLDWRDCMEESPELKMLRQVDEVNPGLKYWVTYG